jgi:predicted RNA binding protein YcfA (HicA-like mRNA interferase family)
VTKLEKRIQRLEQNPRSISSKELSSILTALGFECRGGKGSHECYKHPKLPEIKLTVPDQNPLKQPYVAKALDAIHRLEELEDDD